MQPHDILEMQSTSSISDSEAFSCPCPWPSAPPSSATQQAGTGVPLTGATGSGLSRTLYQPGTGHTLWAASPGTSGLQRGAFCLSFLSKEALDEISLLPGRLPGPGPVQATLWGELAPLGV